MNKQEINKSLLSPEKEEMMAELLDEYVQKKLDKVIKIPQDSKVQWIPVGDINEDKSVVLVTIDRIGMERYQFLRQNRKYPNYIIINIKQKYHILKEACEVTKYMCLVPEIDRLNVCGMKIIWTENVQEDEVICGYSNKIR